MAIPDDDDDNNNATIFIHYAFHCTLSAHTRHYCYYQSRKNYKVIGDRPIEKEKIDVVNVGQSALLNLFTYQPKNDAKTMPKHAFYIADFVVRCIEFWCWLFASHVHFSLLCQTAARAPLQDSNCLNCSVLANQWKMGRRIFAYAKSAVNKNSGQLHKYLIYQSVWLAAILS